MEVKIPIPTNEDLKQEISSKIEAIIEEKQKAKQIAQSFFMLGKKENLMGIKNKAKIGNL